MAELAKKRAEYEDLYALPDNMVGEIIDGELIATPRPSRKHAKVEFSLSSELGPPYGFGRGGPGGWVFLIEPEIKFTENIIVPDLAGWRKERFPVSEEHNWISAAPDWVCEIPSPSTLRLDKMKKMPIYARHGVLHLWLIDPAARTLDVFRLESEKWVVAGFFAEEDKARAEPFQEVEIELGHFWLE
ncbi:MAG: Uma2 family endonuclease [Syntrophobacteraceae bacterium]|jgi:Uma2 family endonuclease